MHAPVSMPSAAFDDKRLVDLFYHYAGPVGGRGRGDDILRVEGINLGGHADATVADIVASGYPYDQWAGHFYQAMTPERFVKLGIEAARLGLRVNCVVSRNLEYALGAYEAIDKEVPIRDRRWVVIHVNEASDDQIRRMKALGVIATVVPGFLWLASDRYGLDKLGGEAIPIRRMLDAGVPVALSTDGVPYSMLWTAWEAIARWDDGGQRQLGDSRLTREEALRLSAQSGHRPHLERGSLRIARARQGRGHGGARRRSADLRPRPPQGYRGRAHLPRRAAGVRAGVTPQPARVTRLRNSPTRSTSGPM